MTRLRRILHATDFSRASNRAFEHAAALARMNRAELVLVHVLSPVLPIAGEGYVSPSLYEDLEESARRDGEKRLAALKAKAKRARARATTLLVEGVAHEQIVRAARRRKADMIVIGTHGRTGLAHLFLGSVASHVVAESRCPVLTVRGR